MYNQDDEFYEKKPTIHIVNVFYMDKEHPVLHIKCSTCQLQKKCQDIEHKDKICMLAAKTEKLVIPLCCGYVLGRVSDEFYISRNNTTIAQRDHFKKIIKFLRMKYMDKSDVQK